MKLPKKIDVIRLLKGKKFGGFIINWFVITEDECEKIKGTLKFPIDYEQENRVTITSAIIKFHGKRIVETKNSFFILGKKYEKR